MQGIVANAVAQAMAESAQSQRAVLRKQGEAALVGWTTYRGLLVSIPDLATAWGLTRQGLTEAADRNELFLIKIRGRLWAPAAFIGLERKAVRLVCSEMRSVDPMSQVIFWSRKHGGLRAKNVAQAIRDGHLARVLEIARAWVEEHGLADAAIA